jgi:hypothetical protein
MIHLVEIQAQLWVQLLQYHASINFPCMVSIRSTLLPATNTMKNTIDDAEYIINWVDLIVINQCVKNSRHSHSMVAGGLLDIS